MLKAHFFRLSNLFVTGCKRKGARTPLALGAAGHGRGPEDAERSVPDAHAALRGAPGEDPRGRRGRGARRDAMRNDAMRREMMRNDTVGFKFPFWSSRLAPVLLRTFITLEGMLGDDSEMAERFNIYEVSRAKQANKHQQTHFNTINQY